MIFLLEIITKKNSMKKWIIILIAILSINIPVKVLAQVSFSINLSNQPEWGPSGYDHVDYYYIPDMDAYYDVNSRVYIYMEGGRWVRRSYVPARYRNVDLYRVHKVVINEREPWRHHDTYRNQYSSYRGRYDQEPLRNHHDNGNHYGERGYNNERHDNGHDNGHGNDRGRGNGNGHGNDQGGGHDNGRGNDHEGHDNGHGR